jgi:hypothetical protein
MESGHHRLVMSISGFDPTRDMRIHPPGSGTLIEFTQLASPTSRWPARMVLLFGWPDV